MQMRIISVSSIFCCVQLIFFSSRISDRRVAVVVAPSPFVVASPLHIAHMSPSLATTRVCEIMLDFCFLLLQWIVFTITSNSSY